MIEENGEVSEDQAEFKAKDEVNDDVIPDENALQSDQNPEEEMLDEMIKAEIENEMMVQKENKVTEEEAKQETPKVSFNK